MPPSDAGLRYSNRALIDNDANGLEGYEIDFTKFKERVKDNQANENPLFTRMLEFQSAKKP